MPVKQVHAQSYAFLMKKRKTLWIQRWCFYAGKEEYRAFTRKLAKILDDCKLSKEEVAGRPSNTYYDDTGSWEETKHIHYYFDIEKIKAHKEAALSICRDLPKLDEDIPGFGGVISPIALLSDPQTRTIYMDQVMTVDEFSILLRHLYIGMPVPVEINGSETFLIEIFEEFKEDIQPKTEE